MSKLSPAQQRNLDRLKAAGSVTYTTRAVYKRTRFGIDAKGPFEKASQTGFHLTALRSLVQKGLVVIVDESVENIGGGLDDRRVGNGYTHTWTYKPA